MRVWLKYYPDGLYFIAPARKTVAMNVIQVDLADLWSDEGIGMHVLMKAVV